MTDAKPLYLRKILTLPVISGLKGKSEFRVHMEVREFLAAVEAADPVTTGGERVNPYALAGISTFDLQPTLELRDSDGTARTGKGRVHAALSSGASHFTVTVRSFEEAGQDKPKGFDPKKYVADLKLFRAIYSEHLSPLPRAGLLLFSGGTGTGKTSHLNLILSLLKESETKASEPAKSGSKPGERRPHFAFCGDPVEGELECSVPVEDTARQVKNGGGDYDVTARVLGIDTPSVAEALTDALRETPSVYVISELRREVDIRAALRFAQTGHLVISTIHATSIVDCFKRLAKAMPASSSAGRAELASRVAAILHLQVIPSSGLRELGFTERPVLPALWIGSAVNRNRYSGDGAASLTVRRDKTAGVLGYQWALQELIKKSPEEKERFEKYERFAMLADLGFQWQPSAGEERQA